MSLVLGYMGGGVGVGVGSLVCTLAWYLSACPYELGMSQP